MATTTNSLALTRYAPCLAHHDNKASENLSEAPSCSALIA
jgi:hypothetical protein